MYITKIEALPGGEGITKYTQQSGEREIVTVHTHGEEEDFLDISTQFGCVMICNHCVSRNAVFKGNISQSELVSQCANILMGLIGPTSSVKKVKLRTLAEGEPFLNLKNVIGAFRELAQMSWPFSLDFLLVTTGVNPEGIRELADMDFPIRRTQFMLSLHGPTNEVRRKVVAAPSAKLEIDLFRILEATDEYSRRTQQPVFFNYSLVEDVNEKPQHAVALAELLHRRVNPVLRLSDLNVYETHPQLRPCSSFVARRAFTEIIRAEGVKMEIFHTGDETGRRGCGTMSPLLS